MILALDYGEKRIGVAVTDETNNYVKVLEYIPNKSELQKINNKDLPKGITPEEVKELKKGLNHEAKIEFRKVCNKLLHLINCYYPEKLIIGLPMVVDPKTNLSITGAQAKKVKTFAKKLEICFKQNKIVLPIEFVEETMSSQIAEKNLRAQGLTSNKIIEKIDSESARILLEEYIAGLN